MGGGLMQLVAYGAQDIYLTGNPQITFFKVVYRRHTNFSLELIEQTFNGTVTENGRVTSTISRNGDLVHRLYVNYNPSGLASTQQTKACYMSNSIFKTLELEIGGQKIDKLYGHWLTAQHELFCPNPSASIPLLTKAGYDTTLGAAAAAQEDVVKPTVEQAMAFHCKVDNPASGSLPLTETSAWLPIPFWFCRNVGLALPLIALQYHEVKVILEFEANANITDQTTNLLTNSEMKLWAEYIYLDTDERRRFAQVSHEYLIEQLQFQESGTSTAIDLNFNHPVKEIIFSAKGPDIASVDGSAATHTSCSNPPARTCPSPRNPHPKERLAALSLMAMNASLLSTLIISREPRFGSTTVVTGVLTYLILCVFTPLHSNRKSTSPLERVTSLELTVLS
jgi:hypothetical protein